jgi:hypothetical protein
MIEKENDVWKIGKNQRKNKRYVKFQIFSYIHDHSTLVRDTTFSLVKNGRRTISED